jgi:hypothetical protein
LADWTRKTSAAAEAIISKAALIRGWSTKADRDLESPQGIERRKARHLSIRLSFPKPTPLEIWRAMALAVS